MALRKAFIIAAVAGLALSGCAPQSDSDKAREACEQAALRDLGEDVLSIDLGGIVTGNLSEALLETAGGTLRDGEAVYSTAGDFTFRTDGETHSASIICLVTVEDGVVQRPVDPIISGDPRD